VTSRVDILAERLGAETAHLVGADLPAEILRYAKRENITQIICSRSRVDALTRLFKPSLPDAIVARDEDIAVHIVAGRMQAAKIAWNWPKLGGVSIRAIALPLLAVRAAVLTGTWVQISLDLPNLSMLFLTAVLVCAVNQGTLSAILAAVLLFLAYNFFFIDPPYTFTVARPHVWTGVQF
jgi:two-component system sensor histidine kinase KdpD